MVSLAPLTQGEAMRAPLRRKQPERNFLSAEYPETPKGRIFQLFDEAREKRRFFCEKKAQSRRICRKTREYNYRFVFQTTNKV